MIREREKVSTTDRKREREGEESPPHMKPSHTQPTPRAIRNRDTTVIIRLNNSLSPDLSKNVPVIPSSLFAPSRPHPLHLVSIPFTLIFAVSLPRPENKPLFHENPENYCSPPLSLRALRREEKSKPTSGIDPIARNKECGVDYSRKTI